MDSPIVAPKISHILFSYPDFIFLLNLPILKVLCVLLEWLNFEGPISGTPILVPQILSNFIFCIYLPNLKT